MKEKKEKKQNGYFRHMAEAIKMELREHKSSFMVYLILRILVIVMLVLQVLNQNYENVFFMHSDTFASDCSKFCAGNV